MIIQAYKITIGAVLFGCISSAMEPSNDAKPAKLTRQTTTIESNSGKKRQKNQKKQHCLQRVLAKQGKIHSQVALQKLRQKLKFHRVLSLLNHKQR